MLTTCSLLSLKRDFHYSLFQLPHTFCVLLISLALLKVICFSVISLINITGNQKFDCAFRLYKYQKLLQIAYLCIFSLFDTYKEITKNESSFTHIHVIWLIMMMTLSTVMKGKKNITNVLTIFVHTMKVNGFQNKVTKCIVLEQHESE